MATLLVALIGVGGAAHNQLELREQTEEHQQAEAGLKQRIIVLEGKVRRHDRELAEVRAYLKPVRQRPEHRSREAEPARRGTLLASLRKLWPWGNG